MTSKLRFALLGDNVSYSKSADIFRAIFDYAGVEGSFDIYSATQEGLQSCLNQLIMDGVQGFSVTIPHKQVVVKSLDDLDPVAQALGAVNSVMVDGNRLYGYNTDCFGFGLPLRAYADKLKYGRALILGCGGSARAVVYGLYVDFEIESFTVAGRDGDKLSRFKGALGGRLERVRMETASLVDVPPENNGSWDIIVNCTPLGGWNHRGANPLPGQFDFGKSAIYYDLNYNQDNLVVQAARRSGVITVDGSRMLVGQAVRSFDIWTGRAIPPEPIYQTVFGRP